MSWPTTPTIGDKTTIDGKQWEYMGDGVWERTDISLELGEQHDRQHAMDSEDDHAPAAEADKGKWIRANPDTGKIEYVEAPVGDKNYVTVIEHQITTTINHNLNKKPAVSFAITGGDKVICQINYINNNSVEISFDDYYSGEVICN